MGLMMGIEVVVGWRLMMLVKMVPMMRMMPSAVPRNDVVVPIDRIGARWD